MAETTMDATRDVSEAGGDAATTISHGLRRVWLATLGVLAVAGEELQSTFEALERRGERLEPSMTAPFSRARETATQMADRAGQSVRSAARAVGTATTNVTQFRSRLGTADVREQLERIVEEKLEAALERLDLPSRSDFQALKDRIEELAAKPKRTLQHGRDDSH
jgi:poly(hydroxyalkanoate) granule-associated protein